MRVAIIGAGSVGGAIARGLAGRGLAGRTYDVTIGVRDPSRPDLAALAAASGARLAPPPEAAAAGDIVILALPWAAAESAVRSLGDLSGRSVIDCMNPLVMVNGAISLAIGHTDSGGETVARWLPGAHVVKTLNQVGAEIMARNDHLPRRPVQFVAGDDSAAKAKATALVTALGFDVLDAGDLSRSRILEPLAMVWINQALLRGKGRDWAFAAVDAR